MHDISRILIVALLVLSVGCAAPEVTPASTGDLPLVEVHRSPTCSCCEDYEDYLRAQGFRVREVVREDVADLKGELGIPPELASCHTSLVAGYFVEGHVPAEIIVDLLDTEPQIDGVALPGMPPGSPGMPGVKEGPWTIYSVTDGEPAEYRSY